MEKYVVVIKYNFDVDKPTLVCDTHEEAWKKLLEVLEFERQVVIRESEYEPEVEIFEDCHEATFHYDKGDEAEYFIIRIEL